MAGERRARGMCLVLTAAWVLFVPLSTAAQAARFALVMGSNRGNDPSKTLRYAERDADRFAGVLRSLGGFGEADVQVLHSPRKKEVVAALTSMADRIAGGGRSSDTKALALVYFSGHADGVHLELGEERLPFSVLRDAVEKIGADVKILIMDSCQSGAVTAYKGGRPGPAFDIVLTDTIDANGTAVLTSSAAGEKSQESGRLMGSFFTHFLVSGLSGTADFDQDRRVTLNEIYQYTYNKTVAETSLTMGGVQHPTYDFRITGRGKVVLTDLNLGAAAIEFPKEMSGNFLILKADTNEITAEVTKPADVLRQAALAPGAYRVAVAKNKRVYVATVDLRAGQRVGITEAAFVPEARLDGVFEKGGEPAVQHRLRLSAYYGMLSGALKRYAVLHEGILALRADLKYLSLFPKFTVGATRIDEEGFKYRLLLFTLEGGVAWRFENGPLDLFLGINLGGGYGRQTLASELRVGSMFIYSLLTGLEYLFSRHFSLSVLWEVGSHVYRAENELTQSLLLRGSIGVGVCF